MLQYLFVWTLLLPFSKCKNLAVNNSPTAKKIEIEADSLTFPASWAGIWAGSLEIYGVKGLKQTIPMELHILPIEGSESYTWWIIYGEDKEAGKRAYELRAVDVDKGIYVVDEKNTIKLESYLFGNKLISQYLVAENYITITNEVVENEMIFEVIAGKEQPVSVTGGTEFEGEEIPEVQTFPMNAWQRARLVRQ